MASVSARTGSRRRTINEINMVPFIDVMLVLLIIFMVSAPLIAPSLIDLPSVGKGAKPPEKVIELVVGLDQTVKLRIDGKDGPATSLGDVAARVASQQNGDAKVPVVISADRNVKYDQVVQLMNVLQKAGIQRVGLSVKATGA